MTATSKQRPVIAVDLDEVLGSFMPVLIAWHNNVYGTRLSAEDFHSYQFHEIVGCSPDEMDRRMREFFQSDEFLVGKEGAGIPRVDGAQETLTKLADNFEFHVVTSRLHVLEQVTRRWIRHYFDGVFKEIHFGNHYGSDGVKRSKVDMCRTIDAMLIIDDSLHYTFECADGGISAIIFGHYPWNQFESDLPAGVVRAPSWAEVYKALVELKPA